MYIIKSNTNTTTWLSVDISLVVHISPCCTQQHTTFVLPHNKPQQNNGWLRFLHSIMPWIQ